MRGILVTGGEPPRSTVVLPEKRFLVAADSGLDSVAERGWKPNLIVGDMDSISDKTLLERYPETPKEIFPREKDLTDTEIALQSIWKRGIENVTILGAGGGRLDHLIGLLSLFEREKFPQTWITNHEIVECTENVVEFSTKPGSLVSIFPVRNSVCRMNSEGLKWSLNGLIWERGDVGISNETTTEQCRVEVLEGRILIIRELPDPILVR